MKLSSTALDICKSLFGNPSEFSCSSCLTPQNHLYLLSDDTYSPRKPPRTHRVLAAVSFTSEGYSVSSEHINLRRTSSVLETRQNLSATECVCVIRDLRYFEMFQLCDSRCSNRVLEPHGLHTHGAYYSYDSHTDHT